MLSFLPLFGSVFPPQATITLKKGDQEWKLNLGRQREGTTSGVVYVTSSDEPKEPKAVRKSELDLAFKSLADFRAKDLLTESSLNLQSVKLQKEKTPPIALEKVAERRWRFKERLIRSSSIDGVNRDFIGDMSRHTRNAPSPARA